MDHTSLLNLSKPGARGTHPPTTELRDALRDNADILDRAVLLDSDGDINVPRGVYALYTLIETAGPAAAHHVRRTGDSDYRLVMFDDGAIEWGPGSATRDTRIERLSAGLVGVNGNLAVRHATGARTEIGDDGSGHPAVLFGTARLAELSAGTLRTIGGHEATGHVRADVATSTEVTLGDVQGNGNPGIQFFHDTAIVRTTGGHVQIRSTAGVEVGNYDFSLWQDITAASFIVAPSARGDKENIEPITGAIDKLRSLTGYSYTVKASGKPYTGVMAEDMEEHFGHLVTDLVGPDGEASKAVDYVGLIAPLVAGTQENADGLDALTARVAALEAAAA